MDCDKVKFRMLDYLDDSDQLNNALRTEIVSHMHSCADCADEFRQVQLLDEKMQHTEMIEGSVEFHNTFITRLEKEKASHHKKTILFRINRNVVNIAASILLLFTGILMGCFLFQNKEVSKLETEIETLKHAYTLSVLKNQTASERIKALSFMNEEKTLDPELITMLKFILNNDDNVNVRLAAAHALFKHNQANEINTLLIESLKTQTEPLVQISLINFLVDEHEKKAVENLKVLLENESTNAIVKQYASNGLSVLL